MEKSEKLLTKVEQVSDSDESINRIVVVPEKRRILSISEIVAPVAIRYESVQVAAKIIGGSRRTYQVTTDMGWFRKPVITTIEQTTWAVRKRDGSTLLVDEESLVFVYDETVWDSDSKAPKGKAKTSRKGTKVTRKS